MDQSTLDKRPGVPANQMVRLTFPGRPLPWINQLARRAAGTGAALDWLALAMTLGLGAVLRLWAINDVGFNSDEAVYTGQAAAIAATPTLKDIFPLFRAHPLLFQFLVALGFRFFGVSDLLGRLFSVCAGLATIYLVYHLGKQLYGRKTGLCAALFMALMPYHMIVTRQVLLDGPMVLFATLTLYMLVRFALTQDPVWLFATGAGMGLTFLAKETGIILLAGIYAFLALCPSIRVRIRDAAVSIGCMILVIAPHPIALSLAGTTKTAQQFLVWQLYRRPNHEWTFYLDVVPPAIGPLVIATALLGFWLLHRERSWREVLLLAWIVVPTVFFQLWPTKGFQYLLPVAPALAILAGRTFGRWAPRGVIALGRWRFPRDWIQPLAVAAIALSLLIAGVDYFQAGGSNRFIAGGGGIPGGREAGEWVREHVPGNARLLTIGPSMANIIQFYGHRKAYGLSVSPNPLRRNPVYEPIHNPDLQIRNGELHYLVWDAYSASRSAYFADSLLRYVERHQGRVVHAEFVDVPAPDGSPVATPIIVIYEVRP
jgi:hypothetical protein